MRRREFITLFASGATTWSLVAHAQQPAMPVIGYLYAGSPDPVTEFSLVPAFRAGLGEVGFTEGKNVAIEFRWARDENKRLPELVADLVRRGVTVIVTPGSTPSALAAKAATTTIPIVFYVGGDPIQLGLVESLNRPGGNVTGVSALGAGLGIKRLQLLHELLPAAVRFAVLINPNNQQTESAATDVRGAASTIGAQVDVLTASNGREIDAAFASLVQKRADAVMIEPDALFRSRRAQIITLLARHALPSIFGFREYAEAGGLMSYGSNLRDNYRQAGIYAGRILKGEKPGNLPVLQASKFELVINLQTAGTIGIDIPPTLLARADEVIE